MIKSFLIIGLFVNFLAIEISFKLPPKFLSVSIEIQQHFDLSKISIVSCMLLILLKFFTLGLQRLNSTIKAFFCFLIS